MLIQVSKVGVDNRDTNNESILIDTANIQEVTGEVGSIGTSAIFVKRDEKIIKYHVSETKSEILALQADPIAAESVDTRTDTGAVSVTTKNTLLVTTGAATGTLADGVEGQEKTILFKTDGGDFVLTPTNLEGGGTITFDDAGDMVKLKFLNGKWVIVANRGCSVNEVAGTVQILTGAGAVSVKTKITHLVTTGANALTMAAGVQDQIKIIKMKTDGGDGTLTPTGLVGGTTIVFNDAGDYWMGVYSDGGWHTLINSGCTIS